MTPIEIQLTISMAWQVVQSDALTEVDAPVVEGLPVSAMGQQSHDGYAR